MSFPVRHVGAARKCRALPRPARRGAALLTTLVFTTAIAALAISAIYMGGHVAVLGKTFERERDYRYAAEAALAIGKSRVNIDTGALPPTGYNTLMADAALIGADGVAIPRARVNLYAGPTGSTSGQFGTYASIIAEARDANGARFVRRLEVTQESFAKFAYFSQLERMPSGAVIYFGGGDVLWGPVHSNDSIRIYRSGATFNDIVTTSRVVMYPGYGTFKRGYLQNQPLIPLPNNARLARLESFATSGSFNFTAPNRGTEDEVLMRVEFVAADISAPLDGDSLDVDEGFFKVYTANPGEALWLRGNYRSENCGAYYNVILPLGAPDLGLKFFPHAVHATAWFRKMMDERVQKPADLGGPGDADGTMTLAQATTLQDNTLTEVMVRPNSRCYPGGDNRLAAVERNAMWNPGLEVWPGPNPQGFTQAQAAIGGDERTFTPTGTFGRWTPWVSPPDARLNQPATHAHDAGYLFPIYRGLNPGAKGVIRVLGTVGVSGTLRGKITMYAEDGNIVVLDDLRYSSDPAMGRCLDILGVIAGKDFVLPDNGILNPQDLGVAWRFFDDTPGEDVHAVIMTLKTSFRAQNYWAMPDRAIMCGTSWTGRGCLNLAGGIIMDRRGAVGTFTGYGITGYVKRYSYDRCAAQSPPPYFPTTGKFVDNRYYEVDPSDFSPAEMFKRLTPAP